MSAPEDARARRTVDGSPVPARMLVTPTREAQPRNAARAPSIALHSNDAMRDENGAGYGARSQRHGRRDRFVAAGFGEGFVVQLKQAAVDLQRAVDFTSVQLGHRAAATSGMLQELARGRDLVRLLDAMVGSWLEDQMQDRVAEWKTLTRFVRMAPPVEAAVAEAAGTTPTPTIATPTTSELHAA